MATAVDDTTISDPSSAAARAVPASPSACASHWNAHGATITGDDSAAPSTVTDGSGDDDARSTRGLSTHRSNARRFSAIVHSSPAPPAK